MELSHNAIAGPFKSNPSHQTFTCSPLQTVPKRGSTTWQVVMDLSYPLHSSVNNGIVGSSYLDEPYRLPGIDRLSQFILQHGHGCLLYKKDLQ